MPVSQRQLQTLAQSISAIEDRNALERLSSDSYFKSEVLEKRVSILDILEDFPSCSIPFASYLDMLKPLSPRQFSISSSPVANATQSRPGGPVIASITFDVHEAPARSGNGKVFQGVASTYLATRSVNSKLRCFVRATNTSFRLPTDTETPIVMISAGTGIAPMRGFIQERAEIARAGVKKLGKALLYFGCRDYEKDFIYADQLKEWERMGAVEIRPCFSKRGPDGEYQFKYVPDRMWEERAELVSLFREGAKIFVCGSASKLAKCSADVSKKIWLEGHPGKSEEDAFEWLQRQREDRYVSDVFD
jgi:cytochrome P450/NADPH-cytochrome P450 reductase